MSANVHLSIDGCLSIVAKKIRRSDLAAITVFAVLPANSTP
jgi:hypothetical protein